MKCVWAVFVHLSCALKFNTAGFSFQEAGGSSQGGGAGRNKREISTAEEESLRSGGGAKKYSERPATQGDSNSVVV